MSKYINLIFSLLLPSFLLCHNEPIQNNIISMQNNIFKLIHIIQNSRGCIIVGGSLPPEEGDVEQCTIWFDFLSSGLEIFL